MDLDKGYTNKKKKGQTSKGSKRKTKGTVSDPQGFKIDELNNRVFLKKTWLDAVLEQPES
jgi:hypothetical protein